MNAPAPPLAAPPVADDAWGIVTEPATLTLRRRLPGPIERVWAWLTDSDLRRRWLAAGTMDLAVGAPFELVWRNDTLTDPPGRRPDGFAEEHRMACRITEVDPPRRLAFTWQGSGDVSFDLAPAGDDVLLTVIHRRLPDRATLLSVGPGWHAHLDLLVSRVTGGPAAPHWDHWTRLRGAYDARLPDR